MQQQPQRLPPAAMMTQAARPVRPLMQQSNQFVKRLTLIGIHMKQAHDSSLATENVKESLVQFLGYLTDRVLDYTLTTLSKTAAQQEDVTIEDIQHFCSDYLGYNPPDRKARLADRSKPSSQALNLSIHRRKYQTARFRRLDARKIGVSVFKRPAAS
eukprot:Gregarina_sp_Poly_1__6432@NODE_343_length_9409_cov_658_993470_g287_i0_p6_GENE_NODE_343_length_9409_cov_658_993470_g287_i0NODE_343_length_9409_cov_658_993470_g287_i0_p6_ORF_typecomplete_len157_score28_04FAS_N/PF17828_1/0_083_NODE_343_length_9409_cov_658_993470_g287_i048575327